MKQVEGIVVLRWPLGYTAYLTFANPRDNIILSGNTKSHVYYLIDKYMWGRQ